MPGSGRGDLSFGPADLTAFWRLDELGLEVTGQRLEPGRAVLKCRVSSAADSNERWCRDCGCEGTPRDTVSPAGARAVRVAAHHTAGHGPLRTGADLLTDRQNDRLTRPFDVAVHRDGHVEVDATWGVHQAMVAAYREPDQTKARTLLDPGGPGCRYEPFSP